MLRACIIGMGPVGNIHADVYRQLTNAELVAVCDVIPERAEAAGKKYGIPYYLAAGEMLAKEKPDIVSVATGGFE